MTKNPDTDYIIAAVPTTLLDVVWPMALPHIERVIEVAHDEITVQSVYNKLIMGNALLVTISKGPDIVAVNTMEVRTFESGKRAMFIPITGGDHLEEWMPRFLDVAKAIAKDFNCTELRGIATRKGWLRVLKEHGWEFVHEAISCKIEEEE